MSGEGEPISDTGQIIGGRTVREGPLKTALARSRTGQDRWTGGPRHQLSLIVDSDWNQKGRVIISEWMMDGRFWFCPKASLFIPPMDRSLLRLLYRFPPHSSSCGLSHLLVTKTHYSWENAKKLMKCKVKWKFKNFVLPGMWFLGLLGTGFCAC